MRALLRKMSLLTAALLHCGANPTDAPQIHDYGGPVLEHPKVVPIFFANDADQPQIEAFLGQLAASTYWPATTAEYGVGPLTVAPSVVTSQVAPPTITSADIEAWLTTLPYDSSVPVYAIFYPSNTTIVDGAGDVSCAVFGGFHGEARTADGKSIVYVVLPRCAAQGELRGLDALTAPLSHELIEAATDPFVRTNRAYAAVDGDHMVWNVMPLGEVGDLCSYDLASYQRLVGPFVVQRVWSNAAAKAGHHPCVPAPAAPYFKAVPVLVDELAMQYRGREVSTRGVSVPLGESRTIDVRLVADGRTEDWTVTALDVAVLTNEPAQLSFSWDAQRGNDGDTLHLTITRLANGPYRGSEIAIDATQGDTTNRWYGFIGN